MVSNPLLKQFMEDESQPMETGMSDAPGQDQGAATDMGGVEAAMEELQTYIGLAENLQEEISQNEVNIANIVQGDVPSAILSPDGEFLAEVNTELSPTITSGDKIEDIIPLEIQDQNNRIFSNGAGQFNYTVNEVDDLKEDLGVSQDYVTLEHARISPLHMYRVHTESLKEVFSKIIEKIKEVLMWIQSKLKNIGHDLLLVFEEIFKVRDGLIKKFKEGSDKEKRLKDGGKFKGSTVLTMLTDYPGNLDTAIELQTNVLQPYTKQFIEAYQKKDDMRLDTLMKKAREDLLAKKNKDGENFLSKLGIKNTEGFICIVRPGQILKLDVSGDMWSVVKEDIDVPEDVLEKLMNQVKVDVLWDDALEYLNALTKVDRVSRDFMKLLNTVTASDVRFVEEIGKNKENNITKQFKFYYNIMRFKQSILTCVISTPRAIYSACKDIYANIEIKQPNGDYSVMALPKPATESFFDFFKKKKTDGEIKNPYGVVESLIISTFFNKNYLSKMKNFLDKGAKEVEDLLNKTNKELASDSSSFSKLEEVVKKANDSYFNASLNFNKEVINFLKSMNVSKEYIDSLSSSCSLLSMGVHAYDRDTFYTVLRMDEYGNIRDDQFNITEIRNGYLSLPVNTKLKLLESLEKNLPSLDLSDKSNVWKAYKAVKMKFDKGTWGEYDNNLNDRLGWFWACEESPGVYFELDCNFTAIEIINMIKETIEKEKSKLSSEKTVSQEFFGLFKKEKPNENLNNDGKMDIISAMVISNFYTLDNFKAIKTFCDASAKKCRELLVGSNKDLNLDNEKEFAKWDKIIDKEIANYVKEASKLSKRPIEFLKSIGISGQLISKLQSYGSIISLTKVLFKDCHDATICAVVVLNDGNMTELRLDDGMLRRGFDSLPLSKKESLIKLYSSRANVVDYVNGKTVWDGYKKLYDEFINGEFGEYDDNLNNKLTWFWDAAEQGVGDFRLDYEYTVDEIKRMVNDAFSDSLNSELV